jgi:hypothetical protein
MCNYYINLAPYMSWAGLMSSPRVAYIQVTQKLKIIWRSLKHSYKEKKKLHLATMASVIYSMVTKTMPFGVYVHDTGTHPCYSLSIFQLKYRRTIKNSDNRLWWSLSQYAWPYFCWLVLQFDGKRNSARSSQVVHGYVNKPTGSTLLMTLVQSSSHCTARTLCRGSRSTSFPPDAPQSAFDCIHEMFQDGKVSTYILVYKEIWACQSV